MLEEEGRKGMTGWVSGWLGGARGAQSVPTTPQRPTYNQNLNGVSFFPSYYTVRVQDMHALS